MGMAGIAGADPGGQKHAVGMPSAPGAPKNIGGGIVVVVAGIEDAAPFVVARACIAFAIAADHFWSFTMFDRTLVVIEFN